MIRPNRVGTSREVLPEWGVVWQTKDIVRDEISAPAAQNWITSILLGVLSPTNVG